MIKWVRRKFKRKCTHPEGHFAIRDMARKRYLFICKECGHHFNLPEQDFDEDVLEWLDSDDEKRLKFTFIPR